ncbi:MAG: MBL fold metallo-hydrolase [Desulfobulbus sp.]|jgi:7,8-dihydropterin-6-yl-methyl-4-(beta-D-ribofuranosyl)aminobenzene 5'-phosphate synthase
MATWDAKVTILVDNEAGAGFQSEFGLALWVENRGTRFLFDTGQEHGVLRENAEQLGIDPGAADYVILSHGHYDHCGGLAELLTRGCHSSVHCHPSVVQPRYSIRNKEVKAIQMPRAAMAALDHHPQELVHWVQQPVRLTKTVGLTGPIPRETLYEDVGGPFYLDQEGRRPDPIDDDLALWVDTDDGLIVCVGCAHAGVVNTLRHVQRLNNGKRIRAVIGGFHLRSADRRRMDSTIAALDEFNPERIVPCHCTGTDAVQSLHEVFGKRCWPGMTGMTCVFD